MAQTSNLNDGFDIFHNFLALHKSQLEDSGVPGHFWETLCRKLHDQSFDAGNTFSLLKIEYDEGKLGDPLWKVVSTGEVKVTDPQHVYLIDHAWTYKVEFAKAHLRVIPGLLERMCNLMGIEGYNENDHSLTECYVEKVFHEMWKFNQTYAVGALANIEDRLPVWYIMDEFGSAIQHSDNPSFRIVPFIHMPHQVTYSILFPVQSLKEGDEVTRDYVEGHIQDTMTRKALLLPWQPTSFMKFPFHQSEPYSEYFLEGHVIESLPNLDSLKLLTVEAKHVFKVYSEYSFVNSYLHHPRFEIVNNVEDADILWYMNHFKDFKELSEKYPHKYVNQFPFEHIITVKDLLCIVCRRNLSEIKTNCIDILETSPPWFPTTYNLKTELPQFVSYFQHREENKLDNHWICKPFNLARGLDTHITNDLNYILRLPFTGPKIAQKYLENPVLFNRLGIGLVKFDIRYVLLLKSVSPLKAYAYKNFFLRFANVPFELQDFENYEKHFTVMNYNENANLCRMLCDEFIKEFEGQFNCRWSDTEEKIFQMLSNMFQAATIKAPPVGIAHNPQSRAVFAVDLMLSWKNDASGVKIMQPKLLEVNWCPDCQRACEYYPNFYDKIFALFFLDEENEDSFRKL